MNNNIKNKLFILSILCVCLIIFLGCNSNENDVMKNKLNPEITFTGYDSFEKYIHSLQDVKLKDFILLNDGTPVSLTTGFFETKLDARKSTDLSNGKPSQFIYTFTDKNCTIFIKTTFIYHESDSKGILLYSNTSSKDEMSESKSVEAVFKNSNGLFLDTMLVSIGDYMVLVEAVLPDELPQAEALDGSDMYLANMASAFVLELQDYLLERAK